MKYYDNDEPIFVSNFGGSDPSRPTYRSPLRNHGRSQSPLPDRIQSITEEENDGNMTEEFGRNSRYMKSPGESRHMSQSRFSEFPANKMKILVRSDDSQRSLSRLTEPHFATNRYAFI